MPRSRILVPILDRIPSDATSEFGPVDGAQSVRDGVGPRTVADPGGGVAFTSASNIQTLIDGNSANTIFTTSSAGTYNNFRSIVYSQKHPRFYFIGNASSFSINGGSTDNIGLNGTGSGSNGGLEVYGGTWTAYGAVGGSAVSVPPINIGGGGGSSIIQDAVFTANNQIGLSIYINVAASSTIATALISHCSFTSNGRYGLSGSSSTTGLSMYAPTVEYCLIQANNARNLDPGDDAGGQKFGYSNGGIWRYNHYIANIGFGCWLDGPNYSASIHDQVTEDNVWSGTFYEIGNGGSVIEHNASYDDGVGNGTWVLNSPFNNGGIHVSCAAADGTGVGGGPNITNEIRYNLVDVTGSVNGICLIDHSAHAAANQTRNWSVHDNQVWQRGSSGAGRTGLFDPHNENLITLAGANNDFDHNEYHVTTVGGSYYEADGSKTLATFQAAGYEATGSEAAI